MFLKVKTGLAGDMKVDEATNKEYLKVDILNADLS